MWVWKGDSLCLLDHHLHYLKAFPCLTCSIVHHPGMSQPWEHFKRSPTPWPNYTCTPRPFSVNKSHSKLLVGCHKVSGGPRPSRRSVQSDPFGWLPWNRRTMRRLLFHILFRALLGDIRGATPGGLDWFTLIHSWRCSPAGTWAPCPTVMRQTIVILNCPEMPKNIISINANWWTMHRNMK